jgi:hypothetical protein
MERGIDVQKCMLNFTGYIRKFIILTGLVVQTRYANSCFHIAVHGIMYDAGM